MYSAAMRDADHKWDFELTKCTPIICEPWDVFCENVGENWLRYNGTAWYPLFVFTCADLHPYIQLSIVYIFKEVIEITGMVFLDGVYSFQSLLNVF